MKEEISSLSEELKNQDDLYNTQLNTINKINGKLKDNQFAQSQNSKNIQLINSKLEDTKKNANTAKDEVTDLLNQKASVLDGSVSGVKEKVDKCSDAIKKFGKRISSLIASALVFNVISKYLNNLKSKFGQLLNANDQFSSSLNQIKANLMTAFTPIYNSALPAINSLMTALSKLTGTLAIFVNGLFGKSITEATNDAKKLNKTLNKTADSVNEASGGLGSFDKLEVIGNDSSSNSSSSTSGSDSEIDFSGELQYSQRLLNILNTIKEKLSPIFEDLKEFYDEHGPIATAILTIGTAFGGWLVLKFIFSLFTKGKKAVSGLSADFTDFFSELGKATEIIALLGGLALVIESITDLIDAFSASELSVSEFAGLLITTLASITLAFEGLMVVMTALNPSWQSIAGAAVIFAGLAIVMESCADLITAFGESGLELNDIMGIMGTILVTIIALMTSITVLGPLMTAGLGPFLVVVAGISAILLVMATTLPTILDSAADFIERTAPSLCDVLDVIGTKINDMIYSIGTVMPPIIESIGNLYTKVFSGIGNVIKSAGSSISDVLNSTGKLVVTILQSIINFINDMGPAMNNFTDNAISAVTKLVNFMISAIEYLVNTLVVGGVNKIINGINAIGDKVGFTLPTISNMSIPRFVPKLAKGAVLPPRQEFLAVVGDQKHGTNIEAPLKTIEDALENVLNRRELSSEEKEIILKNWSIILQLGSKTARKFVIDEIRAEEKATGLELLLN